MANLQKIIVSLSLNILLVSYFKEKFLCLHFLPNKNAFKVGWMDAQSSRPNNLFQSFETNWNVKEEKTFISSKFVIDNFHLVVLFGQSLQVFQFSTKKRVSRSQKLTKDVGKCRNFGRKVSLFWKDYLEKKSHRNWQTLEPLEIMRSKHSKTGFEITLSFVSYIWGDLDRGTKMMFI